MRCPSPSVSRPSSTRTPVASGLRRPAGASSAGGGSRIDRHDVAAFDRRRAVDRSPEPVDDATEQRVRRAHCEAAARRLDLVVGADAGERAERHRDRLAASNPTTSHASGSPRRFTMHDVADAHARHAEAQAEARSRASTRPVGRSAGVAASFALSASSEAIRSRSTTTSRLPRGPCRASRSRARPAAPPRARRAAVFARSVSCGRDVDLNDRDERAAAATVEPRNALALDREHRAGLRARRDLAAGPSCRAASSSDSPSDGTRTSAPSAASANDTCTRVTRSAPSRSKRVSSSTSIST